MTEEKKKFDLKQYRILSKKKSDDDDEEEELTYYKYSDIEPTEDKKNLVKYYVYDQLSEIDIKKAYILLFAGKTGEGKTTAINALFNVIKGVRLKDNFRFILIEEIKKPKGQAESQTDGIHMYYLKDYNNEPLIIIDSQGYGDTRGHEKDLAINAAFEYVFSNVIDHINSICFIANSTKNRVDISTKYIYSCVTALFADDVTDNFIVLATHANKDSMKKPAFVETIVEDAEFLKLKDKENKKWWYTFCSKSILDNDLDKLTKFSYKELNDFYEKFAKNCYPKPIKNCAEVLKERNSLRREVSRLEISFKQLMMKNKNLHSEDEAIIRNTCEINNLQEKILLVQENCKNKDPVEKERLIKQLMDDLRKKEIELDNQTIEVTERQLVKSDYRNTYCNACKENCHSPCNCWFTSFGRCRIFEVKGCLGILKNINDCEHCPHTKSEHSEGNFMYKSITEKKKANNEDKKKELKNRNDEETQRLQNEIEARKDEQEGLKKQIKELNDKKAKYEEKKRKNEERRDKIKNETINIQKEILIIFAKLQEISAILESKALNNSHIKTHNDYIDQLKKQIDDIDIEDPKKKEKEIEKLERMKKINNTYLKAKGIQLENLKDMNNDKLIEIIKDLGLTE